MRREYVLTLPGTMTVTEVKARYNELYNLVHPSGGDVELDWETFVFYVSTTTSIAYPGLVEIVNA